LFSKSIWESVIEALAGTSEVEFAGAPARRFPGGRACLGVFVGNALVGLLLSQWWAQVVGALEFTRINTTPTFLRKKTEELPPVRASCGRREGDVRLGGFPT
jgi:hypothetical protein